jgi:hypothetical protein
MGIVRAPDAVYGEIDRRIATGDVEVSGVQEAARPPRA